MKPSLFLTGSLVGLLAISAGASRTTPLAGRAVKPVRVVDHSPSLPRMVGQRAADEFDISLLRPSRAITPFHTTASFGASGVRTAAYAPDNSADTPMIRANVLFSTSWGGVATYGIYELPAEEEPAAISLVKAGDDDWYATAGAVYAGSKYFMASSTDYYGYRIISCTVANTSTWERDDYYYGDQDFQALDMAYDRTTGNIYGAFMDMNLQSYVYGTLDISNGHVTLIRNLGRGNDSRWAAVAVDGDGQLFAISNNGTLFRVDKNTGETETVGATGLSSRYLTTGAIDPYTGKFYYATCNDQENTLYSVDTTNASVTRLYDLPGSEQLTGMYIARPEALPDSPSAVKNLKVNFRNDKLTGEVSFIMPSTLFGGEKAEGEGEWLIRLNGRDHADGKGAYGSKVVSEITVEKAGMYTISVFARNASGLSPVAKTDVWIGKDVPSPVKDLRLSYSDETFTISWSSPEAAHGAYFEPSKVRYNVVRYPDGTVVASGMKERECKDKVSRPEERINYRYGVTATYAGAESETAYTVEYPLGPVVPPYHEGFDSADALLGFTIVDENNDDVGWDWFNGRARMSYSLNDECRDWLITPAIKVEAGQAYRVIFDATSYNSAYPERVSLYAGTAPEASAMNQLLADRIPVSTYESIVQVEGILVPETDGEYYLGILGCSDPMMYYLYVDDLRISEPFPAATPSRVTGFSVQPDAQGYLTTSVSFIAPSTDVAGRSLNALDKVELYRDERLIATLSASPGEKIAYTDTDISNGVHTYTLIAWCDGLPSLDSTIEVFVGNDKPEQIKDVRLVTVADGGLQLSWDAVTTDIRGRAIPPEAISYNVTRFMGESERLIKSGLKECSYIDFPLDEDEEQAFVQYAVNAVVADNEGGYGITEMYPAGRPYGLPFEESFADKTVNHIWAVGKDSSISTGSWNIMSEQESEVPSADGDGWMVSFYSGYSLDQAMFYSGKISLPEDAANLMLIFYCYFIDDSTNRIEVMVDGGEGFHPELSFEAGGYDGWKRMTVDLNAYAGKTVRIAFNGICGNYNLTPVDGIRIDDIRNHNVRIKSISAPAEVTANEPFEVSVGIENIGISDAEGCRVVLYRNGKEVADSDMAPVLSGGSVDVAISQTLSPVAGESVEYSAEVIWAEDENPADNHSGTACVLLCQTTLPAVREATVAAGAGGTLVSWISPDLVNLPLEGVTESFEDYGHLEKENIGNWYTEDRDGIPAGGIDGEPLDGIDGEAVSFFVMDGDLMGYGFDANTGNKYLCSMWVYGGGTRCDDWLVSPELFGGEQTVEFYARCYHPSYPESFEVYYSSDGCGIDDMQLLESVTMTTRAWTRYEIRLPEGARYFAIRGVSNDSFMMFVDDISYIPYGATPRAMELLGYNIYRDGIRLNDTPVKDAEYLDRDEVADGTRYEICAVYDIGESAPVAVVFSGSGIFSAKVSALKAVAGRGYLTVTGRSGAEVTVVGADGKTFHRRLGSEGYTFTLPTGVYMVHADGDQVKVLVR